ncbi:hypothetical protein V2G26_010989 [Clonostachys chloroleuca]
MAATKPPFFGLRGTRLDVAIAIVAGVDMLLFGYDQGVTGGLLTLPSFTSVFPEICTTHECTSQMTPSEKHNRSVIQGIVVSAFSLGCFVGTIALIKLGNPLGRKKTIIYGCAVMLVGAVLQFSAYGLAQFIIGRIICGLGNGFITAIVPVWQAECSKPHRRGLTIAFDMGLNLGGVMIAYWVDFGMSFTEPSSIAWRFPIALQVVFELFIIASIWNLPESPRWLVLQDRVNEASEVLEALYDVPADDPIVHSQLQAIRGVQAATTTKFKEVFRMGSTKNFHRSALAYWIMVLQQLTGINVITYYSTTIYEQEIGLSPYIARLLAGCTATVYFLSSIPALWTMERLGRRTLLMSGSAGMMVSMVIMGVMMQISGSRAAGIVAAAFIFIYQFFFASTWSPASWIYPAEIVPLSIRVQANALSVSANWLVAFMVVMVTPIMFQSISWKTYIVFAVFNFLTVPVIYFLYPETAYRSLEEMDVIFAKSNSPLDVVSIAKNEPKHFDKNGNMIHDMGADMEKAVLGGVGSENRKNEVAETAHVE